VAILSSAGWSCSRFVDERQRERVSRIGRHEWMQVDCPLTIAVLTVLYALSSVVASFMRVIAQKNGGFQRASLHVVLIEFSTIP
jgi:hypothetical protein